jgi:dipeptidyl-peptidase 4
MELPAQIVRTRRFTLGAPRQFSVTADGTTVIFLRSRAGDDPATCLWALDVDTGTERLLADPADLLGTPAASEPGTSVPGASTPATRTPDASESEPSKPGASTLVAAPPGTAAPGAGGQAAGQAGVRRAGAGISGYAADAAAGVVAFALGGGLWTVDVASGAARRLPARGRVADPRPDPAGRRVAYVSEGALRVIEADGTDDRAVAEPDGARAAEGGAGVSFGVGEGAGEVVLNGARGYWWAPDGTRLLVARVDVTGVAVRYVADPSDPARPPRVLRYPVAGEANAEVTLWVAGLDGSRVQVRWDRAGFEYVPRAGWDGHGPYAVVQSRDQRTVRFLGIDPASGESRVVSEQRDSCWVQLIEGLPSRTGSGALVGHADVGTTRHLTVDGVPVTPAGLQVRAVLGVDGEEVLFTASEEPTRTELWTYRAGAGLARLSPAASGVYGGVRRAGTVVLVVGCADRPDGRVEVRRGGRPAVAVMSRAERPVLGLRATRLVLGPRELRADLFLPSWYREGDGRLPVLAAPYGGASRQRVTDELDWRSLVSQWFAEQGFAVLVADGRGTPGRGPAWERTVHGDPYGPVLEDQVTALREAARLRPELDLSRVGIRGWSFGGSLAAVAVLRRPDVFHAAVAGAAVTEPGLHVTHWRERFMGDPAEFGDRYRAESLVRAAPGLTRPLLLIHGLADDNVFAAHALRLSSALLAAGRPHEVLLLPGVGHPQFAAGTNENVLAHQAEFLLRHLGSKGAGREDPTGA